MTSSFSDATKISLLQDPITPPSKVSEAVTSATPTVVLSSTEATTLPTPPSSSSSRLVTNTAEDQDQDDRDQEPSVTTTRNVKHYSTIEETMTRPAEPQHDPSKTHSATSSTSSIALPASITNKHVSLAKTKTLGHLTRSTSSEVDSEVANALASGRSIVSKTDWKEEDAQYLVQLIEKQFPKGNIIWDWVGQQMTSKGFTKSQCRSKWKRIRTKILHSGDTSGKDRDLRGSREQELDELIDDEDINDTPSRDDSGLGMGRPSAYSPARESDRGYYNGNSDNFRDNEDYGSSPQVRHRSTDPYHNRPSSSWEPRHRTDDYPREEYWSDNDESRYPPSRNGGYGEHIRRTSTSSRQYGDRERERERYQPSWSPSENRRRPSSIGYDEDDGPSLSTIVATPNSFGKIEWKPEDSDYLVRLIETKFAARKVDWAWVATKMESRGYDRTQCKSRWWRVQHRQNQANNQGAKNKRTEQPIDELQDDGEDIDVPKVDEHFSESPQVNKPDTAYEDRERMSSSPSPAPEYTKEHTTPRDKTKNGSENESPRAKGQEHQKHIEWKEDDSLFMYRMIEKEFPVGNVVWSVIGEKMASRGYSQTQCMSKWRRHLKNCKLTGESVLPNKQESTDVDMMDTAETVLVDENNRSSSRYRDVGYEDDVTEGAAKRVKTGDYHSRYIIAPELGNIPLDPKLVEEEYDRYYDKGGKRKAVDEDPSSESRVRYLSEALSHSSPPPQAYSSYDEKRHRDDGDHVEHRSKRRELSGSSESRRYAQQDWDPYYDERDSRRGRHVSEERNDRPSSSHDDYAHEKDRSEHRLREPSNGRPHREAPRSSSSHPQDDYPRRDSESRGSVREREYQYKPRGLEYRPRGSDYEYRPRSDYEHRPRDIEYRPRGSDYRPRGSSEYRPRSDYEYKPRSSRTSHSQDRERHRSYTDPASHDYDHREQRERGRERDRDRDRERDHEFGDLDLLGDDEEMDWEAGRWAGRDMARLTAAVARQGRRWDMLREQIRMPTLVPYFEEDEDIYEGMFDAPPPARVSSSHRSYGNSAYDEPMREKHHHHHHHHHQHHRQVSQQFRSTYPSSSSKGSAKQTNSSAASKAVSYSSLPRRSRGEDVSPVAARSGKASYSSLPQQQQRVEHVAREDLEDQGQEDHGMGLEPVPMVLPVEDEEEAREEEVREKEVVEEEMESAPVENTMDEGVAVETAEQEPEESQEEEEGPMVVDEVDAAGTAVVADATTEEEEEGEKEGEVEPLNP